MLYSGRFRTRKYNYPAGCERCRVYFSAVLIKYLYYVLLRAQMSCEFPNFWRKN